MVRLKPARVEDANLLEDISRRAFDDDVHWGGGTGGPPGYDSVEWQRWAMDAGEYLVITLDEQPVGGIIVFAHTDNHYELGRMFVDPAFHRRGIGREALLALEAVHPEVRRWTLETPAWNLRTPAFYRSAGYTLMGTGGDGSLIFEKRLTAPHPAGN